LSEQLLTLAREEPAVTERALAPVDLSELAREVIAELAPLAEAKSIDLGLNASWTASVRGDAGALHALVSNLIDNALRYTPDGGKVDVNVGQDGERIALSVRDAGPGIAPEERARVFDRFYRGQAGSASVPGSGLGLAIVRSVADRHGAEIVLGDGIDGGGLGITVRFPAAS
jgi:two-component system OmpR family sensor kinase